MNFLEEKNQELRILEIKSRLNLKERLKDDNDYNDYWLIREAEEIKERADSLNEKFFNNDEAFP